MAASSPTQSQPSLRVQVRRTLEAPPERVFRAWTTPEELTQWHTPKGMACTLAEVDLRVGGRYRLTMRDENGVDHTVGGTYQIIEPPRRLRYSWRFESPDRDTHVGETTVTIECLPSGTGTELVLTHEGFLTEEARASHERGWTAIVERLAEEV